MVHPDMSPDVAVNFPLKSTFDAVTFPPNKWKLLELISKSPAPDALINALPSALEPIINVEELIISNPALLSKAILSPLASPTLKSPVPSI